MNALKRITTITGLSVILVTVVLVLIINRVSTKALPDYQAVLSTKRISDTVKVLRDANAIPHIYAQTDTDVYFATGVCMAQDRLWQMDLLRRVTTGRLSEIFGEEFVDTDQLLRALRFTRKSESLLPVLNTNEKQALMAFTNGVNYYIEQLNGKLPLEFSLLGYHPEPWHPIHSLNLIGYMAWDLKAGWSQVFLEELKQHLKPELYKELLPSHLPSAPTVFPQSGINWYKSSLLANNKLNELQVQVFSGSNTWAINGHKSGNGKPLLANDMHLGYNIPGIWYQVHQCSDQGLHVTGVAIPGQPFIIAGHNDSIAWGLTNTYVDNVDFYIETMHPHDTNLYKLNGQWKKLNYKKELITTKKGKTFVRYNAFTHRGPVISSFKKYPKKTVSMRWVGDVTSNEFSSIYKVNRAHNWHEFLAAFKPFKSISQNISYADAAGNIGLYCAAGIPIRKRGYSSFFLPGDTTLYDWQGLVPDNQLPVMYKPAIGYIVAANNKTTPNNYPYHVGSWYDQPYRYRRITQMLETDSLITGTDFMKMQSDNINLLAAEVIPDIVTIFENSHITLDVHQLEFYMQMKEWNYSMSKSSIVASFFEAFYYQFLKAVFLDEMGENNFTQFVENGLLHKVAFSNVWRRKNSLWYNNINTPEKEDFTTIVKNTWFKTFQQLTNNTANTRHWNWGTQHLLTLQHPLAKVNILNKLFKLNRGSFPMPGCANTITNYKNVPGNPWEIIHGASQRHIYNTAYWDSSYSIIPTGISGMPASKYYCNQTKLYVNGKYHTDWFSQLAVQKNSKYLMLIIPSQ